MTNVARLRPAEAVRLDRNRIGALYRSAGEQQAEEIICRAMEELAVRLALIERAYSARDRALVAKRARGLVAIAEQVGMTTLARIADDVETCALRGDRTALGATLARLARIADISLTAVWETSDICS